MYTYLRLYSDVYLIGLVKEFAGREGGKGGCAMGMFNTTEVWYIPCTRNHF